MNISKRFGIVMLIIGLSSNLVSCTSAPQSMLKPQVSQMKAITELATMECFFHNVAKYNEKDATGVLLWKKDKHFWVEYSGSVKMGIDPSLLVIKIQDKTVIIQMPEAKLLSSKVDAATLTNDSFIVDAKSAKISAEDETKAFQEAQRNMESTASKDSTLLASAQQRAQTLLEGYIKNIGETVGTEYTIEWKYLNGNEPTSNSGESTDSLKNKEGN